MSKVYLIKTATFACEEKFNVFMVVGSKETAIDIINSYKKFDKDYQRYGIELVRAHDKNLPYWKGQVYDIEPNLETILSYRWSSSTGSNEVIWVDEMEVEN